MTNFSWLLRPTPPMKCFPLKFANKPRYRVIYCIFTAVFTDELSLTLFLQRYVSLRSLNAV